MSSIRTCPKCSSSWFPQPDGTHQHIWASGNMGTAPGKQSELDLAGLVCNKLGGDLCINPCKGREGGQTWASRQALTPLMDAQVRVQLQQQQQCGRA